MQENNQSNTPVQDAESTPTRKGLLQTQKRLLDLEERVEALERLAEEQLAEGAQAGPGALTSVANPQKENGYTGIANEIPGR